MFSHSNNKQFFAFLFLLWTTAATGEVTFTAAPIPEGPVTPYQSGTILSAEENQAELQNQKENWEAIEENIDKAHQEEMVRHREQMIETAAQRAETRNKIEEFAESNPPPEGATGTQVTSIYGDDGSLGVTELWYTDSAGYPIAKATFDSNGELLLEPTQTPLGAALQNAKAHFPAHSTYLLTSPPEVNYNGEPYTPRIDFDNGGGYIEFNQDGTAYLGEFFDADGKRTGGFYDPGEEPKFGDPRGGLNAIKYENHAQSNCLECADKAAVYNTIADEMNLIAREMNDLEQRHSTKDQSSKQFETFDNALPALRARYESLNGMHAALRQDLTNALKTLYKCDDKCNGNSSDSGSFGQDIDLDGSSSSGTGSAYGQCTADVYATVTADTIPCSVHTFAKPDLGQSSNDSSVEVTDTTAVPANIGGGYDTEIQMQRNPQDNNTREGCGDVPPDLISYPPFSPEPPKDKNVAEFVSCNLVAKDKKKTRELSTISFKDYASAGDPEGYLRKKRWGREGREDHPDISFASPREAFKLIVKQACGKGTGGPALPKMSVTFSDDVVKKKLIEMGSGSAAEIQGGVARGMAAGEILTQVTQLGMDLQDGKDINVAEAIATLSEHASTLTGDELTEVTSALGNLQQSATLVDQITKFKDKVDKGEPLTASDFGGITDTLNELRGERFPELGEVLDGISHNVGRIEDAEKVVKKLSDVKDFIDLANAGQQDPVKAAEAFAQYLGMLGDIAGLVPGIGEFLGAYAQGVEGMLVDIKTISAQSDRTRDAIIPEWKKRLLREQQALNPETELALAGFSEDMVAGPPEITVSVGPSAHEINRDNKIEGEQQAVDNAARNLKSKEDCIEYNSDLMDTIRSQFNRLKGQKKRYNKPKGKRRYADRVKRIVDLTSLFESTDSPPRAGDRKSDGSGKWTRSEVKAAIINSARNEKGTGYNANKAYDADRVASMAEAAVERIPREMRELKEKYRDAKKRKEDCEKALKEAQSEYLNALRDFTGAFAYWDAYATGANNTDAMSSALAAFDTWIADEGMTDFITVTVTTVCEESGVVIKTETHTEAVEKGPEEQQAEDEAAEKKWEEFKRNQPVSPEDSTMESDKGSEDDMTLPNLDDVDLLRKP